MLSMLWRLVALNPRSAIAATILVSALTFLGVSQFRLHRCQASNERLVLEAELIQQAQRHFIEERERRAEDVVKSGRVINAAVREARHAQRAAGDDWVGSRRAVVGLLHVLQAGAGDSANPTPTDCPPAVAGYTPARGCPDGK